MNYYLDYLVKYVSNDKQSALANSLEAHNMPFFLAEDSVKMGYGVLVVKLSAPLE